jgi:hypothetical protein
MFDCCECVKGLDGGAASKYGFVVGRDGEEVGLDYGRWWSEKVPDETLEFGRKAGEWMEG